MIYTLIEGSIFRGGGGGNQFVSKLGKYLIAQYKILEIIFKDSFWIIISINLIYTAFH